MVNEISLYYNARSEKHKEKLYKFEISATDIRKEKLYKFEISATDIRKEKLYKFEIRATDIRVLTLRPPFFQRNT